MNIAEIEETIYPRYIALTPQLVLARKQEIINKFGIANFLTRQEFKRAREMYQTAIYALGMTARTGNYFWVTPAKDDTPDTYLIWQQGNELFAECVEITLWNEYVDDMWEIIKKKIDKKYPLHFSIVIHNSQENRKVTSSYYQSLHEKLKEFSTTAGAVRFWTSITNKQEKDVLIGELYPDNTWTEFSATEILKNYSLTPSIFKVDIISNPRLITFKPEHLHGLSLPSLPDIYLNGGPGGT
jgi:hypothetical protein